MSRGKRTFMNWCYSAKKHHFHPSPALLLYPQNHIIFWDHLMDEEEAWTHDFVIFTDASHPTQHYKIYQQKIHNWLTFINRQALYSYSTKWRTFHNCQNSISSFTTYFHSLFTPLNGASAVEWTYLSMTMS